jgi:hypothetical protein
MASDRSCEILFYKKFKNNSQGKYTQIMNAALFAMKYLRIAVGKFEKDIPAHTFP